jgi:c(7)-type cytochrome triheme protein
MKYRCCQYQLSRISHRYRFFILAILIGMSRSALLYGGACPSEAEPGAQSARYQISVDGQSVSDNQTGLIWMRCIYGSSWNGSSCDQGKSWYTWFSWNDAMRSARRIRFGGYEDWRLPNREELLTIVEKGCAPSTIDQTLFPETPAGKFWSSSEYSNNSEYAWLVDFGDGRSASELKATSSYYMRPVRGVYTVSTQTTDKPEPRQEDPRLTDGIHDPTNPDLEQLQLSSEAFENLVKTESGSINWVETLNARLIKPLSSLTSENDERVFDFNIVMSRTRDMPHVMFRHSVHTEWLACSNCHSEIFIPELGANPMSMDEILLGNYCGKCHGTVAFSIFECERCHSILHKDSPQAWWKQPGDSNSNLNND